MPILGHAVSPCPRSRAPVIARRESRSSSRDAAPPGSHGAGACGALPARWGAALALAVILAGALAPAAAIAQQGTPLRGVARLSAVQGSVLVSDAEGLAAATGEQRLLPGARVITTAGARATVVYDRGCTMSLGENRRYMVREQAECAAARAPPLGTAASFAVLGGARVANVGGSVIRGDLGVSPGSTVSGFPQGRIVDGAISAASPVATQAQRDVTVAAADLAAQTCNLRLTGQDLGGQTLTPGVYCFPSAPARLSGELVLDAQGDPDAVFVFQVGTTLTTAAGSTVRVINDGRQGDGNGQAGDARARRRAGLCNVYWLVGDSVTLGARSAFVGTLVAQSGIGAGADATVDGRALARTGAVTLDTNAVEIPLCFAAFAIGPEALGAIGLAIGPGIGIVEIAKKPRSPN